MSDPMNNYPVYGNIICQDAMPDIVRTLDSMVGVVDKTFIVDGGSKDGTKEWLENVKDIYNLEIFYNSFESMLKQRSWLLDKTPLNSWILAFDQDEKLSPIGVKNLRSVLNEVEDSLLKSHRGKNVVTFVINHYHLRNDVNHRAVTFTQNGCKIFFYEPNIIWTNEYHCRPQIKDKNYFTNYRYILVPEIGLLHYAWLNPIRHRQRCKRLKNNKIAGKSEYKFWCQIDHPTIPLEPYLI